MFKCSSFAGVLPKSSLPVLDPGCRTVIGNCIAATRHVFRRRMAQYNFAQLSYTSQLLYSLQNNSRPIRNAEDLRCRVVNLRQNKRWCLRQLTHNSDGDQAESVAGH